MFNSPGVFDLTTLSTVSKSAPRRSRTYTKPSLAVGKSGADEDPGCEKKYMYPLGAISSYPWPEVLPGQASRTNTLPNAAIFRDERFMSSAANLPAPLHVHAVSISSSRFSVSALTPISTSILPI